MSEIRFWSADEARCFLSSPTVKEDRLFPLWFVALATGLRRGELCALRWSDLDLSAGRLMVRQSVHLDGYAPYLGRPKTRRRFASSAWTTPPWHCWRARASSRLMSSLQSEQRRRLSFPRRTVRSSIHRRLLCDFGRSREHGCLSDRSSRPPPHACHARTRSWRSAEGCV